MIFMKRSFVLLLAGLLFTPFSDAAPGKSKKTQPQTTPPANTPPALVIKEIPKIPETDLVAKVGKGGLTQKEYDFYLLRFANRSQKTVQALSEEERKSALNEGLDDEILFQAALADGSLNNKYIRFMMGSLYKSNKATATLDPRNITEEEMKAYYDAHKSEFHTPKELLIKGAKFESAEGAANFVKKLKKSKNPASDSEWKDLGWFTEGKVAAMLMQEVCDMVVKLKKGQISKPIQDPGMKTIYYVFYCVDESPGMPLDFGDVSSKIKFELLNQKQNTSYADLLKKMGFDPKKVSEEDALFLGALQAGLWREHSVREYSINAYTMKKKQSKEKLLPQLRKKYPVTIIEKKDTPADADKAQDKTKDNSGKKPKDKEKEELDKKLVL